MERVKKLITLLLATAALTCVGALLSVTGAGRAVADAVRPLLVQDIDNPTRHAVVSGNQFTLGEGELVAGVSFEGLDPLPAGKRLVIEQFSVKAVVPPGQQVQASLVTQAKGVIGVFNLPMTSQGVFGEQLGFRAGETFFGGQSTRVYADPGGQVPSLRIIRSNGTGTADIQVSIAGHFVTVP